MTARSTGCTDRLDLVTEELDPQRLAPGGREDIDDAASDGELPALVGALDTLVAGQSEVLGERVDTRLVADGKLEPRGALLGRRHPLGERDCRDAHETALRQDVERAGALTDEMRRRFEAGFPTDTAARQERDLFLAEKPGGCFRHVARIRVLGQQTNERALQAKVERSQQERERGLGNAGTSVRERLGEADHALVRSELLGERIKRGTVHDERRSRSVPLTQLYVGTWP